ncbi:MAG: sulfatase-like hydrolase/transferase [Rhizobiaceae bacterium]|nr:sulfatase-like hydrolase/transferase [Rhizobiaceae bacterium]
MTAHSASLGNQPDVLIVICDDLGYRDLGCYGGKLIRTPRLDALAAEGVRFDWMYSGGATCTAARAAMLTGRVAARTGAIEPLRPGRPGGMRTDEVPLSKLLAAEGYQTAAVGKWHVGSMPDNGPRNHGFMSYFGMPYSNDMPPLLMYENEVVVDTSPELGELTRIYTERALSIVRTADQDKPLFLYLAHTMPHQPVVASRQFEGLSNAGIYGDVVEEIDTRFGELLDAFRLHRPNRDHIVVFTADHGPWFEGAPAPSRGRKFQTWDGGFRVPFILSFPGGSPTGKIVEQPVATVDLFPTLCEWLGLDPGRYSLDGEALQAVIAGKTVDRHNPIWFFDDGQLNAVRIGKWKCHRRRHAWKEEPFADFNLPQLFNLEVDEGENYDLSSRHPRKTRDLLNLMDAFQQKLGQEG